MSEWKKVRIGDVAQIYDGPHATPPPCEKSDAYFLGIPHITPSGHIDLTQPRYIAERDYAKWTKRVVPTVGDVVFSYEATLNLYARIPRDLKCCLGRRMGLVRPDGNKLNDSFLYYYFFSEEWRKTVRIKTINGATVDRLPIADFPDFEISLPPLATQRRITSILSNYDSAIANCRRQIALLEEAAMRLYKEWFRDGEGEKKTLGDLIVEIESGSRPRGGAVKSGIPSIGAEKIDGIGNYDYTGEKFVSREYFDRMKRGKIQDEDILLYKDGAYCGKVSMVLDGFPHKEAATNEHVFILRTDRHSAFLYCFLRQRKSFELLNKLACNKAAQPGLNQQDVLGVKIVIPPQDDMESFENKVMPVMHTIAFLANQIRTLTEARDRLLPKLMKGEIAV